MSSRDDRIELVTPIYLDLPMMVSYVAALEEGISYGRRETTKHATAAERESSLKAGINVPLISSILGIGAAGTRQRKATEDDTQEIQLERSHTASSLFIVLRSRLKFEMGVVTDVQQASDLPSLMAGQLVEISGDIHGDPLLRTYEVLEGIAGMIDQVAKVDIAALAMERWAFAQWPTLEALLTPVPSQSHQLPPGRASKPASSSAAKPNAPRIPGLIAQVTDLIRGLRKAAADQPISDFLLSVPQSQLRAVLTLSSEYLTPESRGLMLDGQWTVLGTVTRILADNQANIRLLRRSWLGQFDQAQADELVNQVSSGLNLRFPSLTVEGPAIQLLPLAVFA